jgi:hypothetical protein
VHIGINEDPAGIEVGKAQLTRALEMVELIHSRRSAG